MFEMRLAVPDEFPMVIELIEGAARWLATMGIDQWQQPWPNRRARDARIMKGLEEKITWMAEIDGRVVGTVTITSEQNREVWTTEPEASALYLHRLVVHRDFAGRGIGVEILDWAEQIAASSDLEWIRIDVWRTNERLHKYYQREDFELLGESALADYPSSTLFRRKVNRNG